MKTTIDIPEDLLKESMKYSGAKTKKEAVIKALETYTRRERVEAFFERIEKAPLDLPSNDEIEAADVAEANRQLKKYQERSS